MELLNILYGTTDANGQPSIDNFNAELAPWNPADLATNARILVWKVCFSVLGKKKKKTTNLAGH